MNQHRFSEKAVFKADFDVKTLPADKKKTFEKGEEEKNIRTNRTGLICWRTGFIRQWTGFIRQADEASLPSNEASPPTNEASPFGIYIFTKLAPRLFNSQFFLVFVMSKMVE